MEQINTEDYIKGHIIRVRKHIATFVQLLIKRSLSHDNSKLQEPEFTWWKEMDKEPRLPYGSKEYKEKMKRWEKIFKHHYSYNRHHPEFYENGVNDMTLVDIVEMMCDWLGYKQTISITEALNVCDEQMKRYNISNELRQIIFNTLHRYYSILGGFNPYFAENSIKNIPIGVLEELNPNVVENTPHNKKEFPKGSFIDINV